MDVVRAVLLLDKTVMELILRLLNSEDEREGGRERRGKIVKRRWLLRVQFSIQQRDSILSESISGSIATKRKLQSFIASVGRCALFLHHVFGTPTTAIPFY